MREVIVEAWTHDRPVLYRDLIDGVRRRLIQSGATPPEGRLLYREVITSVSAARRKGVLHSAQPKAAERMELNGRPNARVTLWNESALDPSDATLASAAQPFLADADIPEPRRARLRTALRLWLALENRCSDRRILAAAGTYPVAELRQLPMRVFDKALAGRMGKQAAKNVRTAVRDLLRYVGARGLCPIYLAVEPLARDPWAITIDQLFPLADVGTTPAPTTQNRKTLALAARVLRLTGQDAVTLDCLTGEHVAAVVAHLHGKLGDIRGAGDVKRLFRRLGRKGIGPLTTLSPSLTSGDTPLVSIHDLRLHGNGGALSTWEGSLHALRSIGVPAATLDLLDWYERWVSQTARAALALDTSMPLVPPRLRLGSGALDRRGGDVRMWIGAAIHLRGLTPIQCVPEVLWGSEADTIARHCVQWWLERAKHLRSGGDSMGTANAAGLLHVVVAASVLSYAAFSRTRHKRGAPSLDDSRSDGGRSSVIRGNFVESDLPETVYLAAYERCRAVANTVKSLKGGRSDARGRQACAGTAGVGGPEIKDIRVLLERTPPAYWMRVLDHMHVQIRAAANAHKTNGAKFHFLVQDAFELGLLISTGLRGGEACILQAGVHLKQNSGDIARIELKAHERKNVRPQSAWLQHRFVPTDVLECYLSATLPWLKRGQHEEQAERWQRRSGRGDAAKAQATLERIQEHDFLFVLPAKGRPYEPHEFDDSDNLTSLLLSDFAHKRRVARAYHGTTWSRRMARRAVEAGLEIPLQVFSFTRHGIRGVFASALFVLRGVEAAASYLGDKVGTVEDAYAAAVGILTDASIVADFRVREFYDCDTNMTHMDGRISTPSGVQVELECPHCGSERKRLRSAAIARFCHVCGRDSHTAE